MSTPRKDHWTIVKRVLKYLCGTKYYAICYQGKPKTNKEVNVHGFFGTEWVGDMDQRRSTIRYVLNMFNGAICWMSKRHADPDYFRHEMRVEI
jgi:hypothetical protein